jgi:large subunit ribosomal protein L15
MRYFRRLPKFGFTNAPFKIRFWTVNLSDIIAHPTFTKGGTINSEALVAAGLVRDDSRDLKILGNLGKEKTLKVKLAVEASRVTAPARKLITDAGGSVNETGTRKDMVRGIDRNSDDKSPKNLTKKLKRGNKKAPVAAAVVEAGDKAEAPAAKPAKAEKAPKADKAPKGE